MKIGVTGKNATGKDTVADFLIDKGFTKYSLSDEIREVLREENTKLLRENLTRRANELRKEHGRDVLARRVIERMDEEDAVIVSLRNPAEVRALQEFDDFFLVACKASDKKRFKLMQKSTDREDVTDDWKEFKEFDERELENDDPDKQQLLEVISMADYTIRNDGTIEDLRDKVTALVKNLGAKLK